MDKDQTLEEFFRNFKKTFNITCLFSKDHPSFVKAVENFRNTVSATLTFITPLKIGVTQDSFLVEAKYFSGLMYRDLAKMLHLRRVKSIELRDGATVEELVNLFYLISMHPKEIMAGGGIAAISAKDKMAHISVEELDYSMLLKGSGNESKDMWIYLLQEAVEEDDPAKADALADNFEKITGSLKIKDLLENEKLKENIQRFISYLKDKNKEKFSRCSKNIAGAILKDKDIPRQEDIDKINVFFKDLSNEDFADILSEGLLAEEGFDSLSFGLFSKILDEEKHRNIASLAAKSIRGKSFRGNRRVAKNIQKLLFAPQDSPVSRAYKNALSSFLEDISFKERVDFDPELIYANYHAVLLNAFYEEKNRERLVVIMEKLTVELSRMFRKKELGHLKFLLEAINKKSSDDLSGAALFVGLEKLIYNLVEPAICEEGLSEDLRYFIENIQNSTLGLDSYLNRIFNENKTNSACLRLFLKFFPQELAVFYHNLEKKSQDMEFLLRLIEGLSRVCDPLALEVLKHVYFLSNNFVKIEVLSAMQKISPCDIGFLLSVLESDDFSLKKEALVILRREHASREKALQALFSIKSPWGAKNDLILQNVLVAEQLRLKEAEPYLVLISKKHFFWNRNIRKEAARVLKKWAA
ncbi:MAG: hypothetical protein PHF11_03550 [Candidatus Omnitrophica bacterium]|nr:hypothetical protein [Candidatus Omnitrophota bacterium]